MKKKIISLILIISMLASCMFTGCVDNGEASQTPTEASRTIILQEFSKLSEIPRNTGGDMTAISDYIKNSLKEMGIKATTDDAGNLMAEIPASKGYENSPTTILQTNIDMISVANPSIIFDPAKSGITLRIDEDNKKIYGNNTSLGASSGIGIASILFILRNSSLHGPIKAVFTVDGEGDMTGAKNIDPSFLDGDYLISFTNNESSNIEIESAYSSIISAGEKIEKSNTKNKYSFVLVADGFAGGNSGIGIQNGQGNPIKFLAEVLALAKDSGLVFELNEISGGENVYDIPKSATAIVTVNDYEKSKISSIFNGAAKEYLKDHSKSDSDAKLQLIGTTVPDKALNDESAANLISFLYGLTDGKYNDKSATTASSNIGIINIDNDRVNIGIFVQGKSEASVATITEEHRTMAQISNITLTPGDFINGYNTPQSSDLPATMVEVYNEIIEKKLEPGYSPTRTELGFFQEKNQNLQMVSIGPTIRNEGDTKEYAVWDTAEIPATATIEFLTKILD